MDTESLIDRMVNKINALERCADPEGAMDVLENDVKQLKQILASRVLEVDIKRNELTGPATFFDPRTERPDLREWEKAEMERLNKDPRWRNVGGNCETKIPGGGM